MNVIRGLPLDGAARVSARDGSLDLHLDGNAQDLIRATYDPGFRINENFLPSRGRIGLGEGPVVNTISDADLCEAALVQLDHVLEQSRLPCFNSPAALRRCRRDRLSAQASVFERFFIPPSIRIRTPDEAGSSNLDLEAPLLLRPAGSHTGDGLVRLRDGSELEAAMQAPSRTGAWHLSQFVDYARDGVFSKLRLAVIGEQVVPRHCLRSAHWQIHAQARTAEDIEVETAYLDRVSAQIAAGEMEDVRRLAAHLGLDYFGVDLGVRADGAFVLFEANPAMRILDESKSHQARFRPYLDAIGDALMQLVKTPRLWRDRAKEPV